MKTAVFPLPASRFPLHWFLLVAWCLVGLWPGQSAGQNPVETTTVLGRPAGDAADTGCIQLNVDGRLFGCDPDFRWDGTTNEFIIDGTPVAPGGLSFLDEGIALTTRSTLNFLGTAMTCVDNPGDARTDCTIGGTFTGDITGNAVTATTAETAGMLLRLATAFSASDPTPDVTGVTTSFFVTADDTVLTDFDDGDDHSEFTTDRVIFISFAHPGGILCSDESVFSCNNGTDWDATVGDVALCVYSPITNRWACYLPTVPGGAAPTLDQVTSAGSTSDNHMSLASAFGVGGTSLLLWMYQDGTGALRMRVCDANQANCVTSGQYMEAGSDYEVRNQHGSVCYSIDSVTGAYTPTTNGLCAPTFVSLTATQTLTNKTLTSPTLSGTVAGSVTMSGLITSTGGTKHAVTAGTADTYAMLDSDCGTTIANDDADTLEVDLLADPTGCVVCFYAQTAHTITLDPNSTDSIIISGLSPAAGDAIQLAGVIGNNLCLHGKSTSLWLGYLGTGTVTDVN